MKRRLLSLLTALSLLLCVAACVLWVRSYWATDGFTWMVHRGACDLRSSPGRLAFLRAASIDEAQYPFATAEIPTGYHRGPPTSGPAFAAPAWSVAGFSHTAVDVFAMRVHEFTVPHWFVAAAAAALPCSRAAAFALRVRRRRNAREKHACPSCGYDLRATPDRCPECGTVRT
jgi:hypothetical protein